MTQEQMNQKTAEMGCKRMYRPIWEQEAQTITLKTRKPAVIVEGLLKGTGIDIYDDSTFRIWTPQVKKAKAYARTHNLKIRNMTGECDLFVPGNLADEILPKFGAKRKQVITPERLKAMKQRGQKLCNVKSLPQNPD